MNFIAVFKTTCKRSMLQSPKSLSFAFNLILSAYLQEKFKVASDIQVVRPKLSLSRAYHIPFEDGARTAVFKDPVGTAQ
jgi:hypothetical protein